MFLNFQSFDLVEALVLGHLDGILGLHGDSVSCCQKFGPELYREFGKLCFYSLFGSFRAKFWNADDFFGFHDDFVVR